MITIQRAAEIAVQDFKLTAQGDMADTARGMYAARFEGPAYLSDISGVYPALHAVNKRLTKFEAETGLTHETFGGVVFMLAKALGIDSVFIERKTTDRYANARDRFCVYSPKDSIDWINWRIQALNDTIKTCNRLSFERV